MRKQMTLAATVLAATTMLGFDRADPWQSLEGEWALQSTNNCGGVNSVQFTYDYRRDRDGNLVYLNNQPPNRRDRLATVRSRGHMAYLANVGDNVTLSWAGQSLQLRIRRTSLWPFRDFDDLFLAVENNDTLLEQSSDGDADALMRALGGAPVQLVRCPEGME